MSIWILWSDQRSRSTVKHSSWNILSTRRHLYVVVIVNRSRYLHRISENGSRGYENSVLILEQNLNGGLHQLVSIPWSSTGYLCSRDHCILTVWRGTRCDRPNGYTSMWSVCPFPTDGLYLNTGGTCVVLDTEKSHTFYAYISATSAVWLWCLAESQSSPRMEWFDPLYDVGTGKWPVLKVAALSRW